MILKNVGRLGIKLRSSRQSQFRRNYCSPQNPGLSPSESQVPVGLGSGPPPITSAVGKELAKAYNPVEFEPAIRERWKSRDKDKTRGLESGPKAPPFRMILPPPNVTGKLHLGHALTIAIQDTIVRLKHMTGSKVEWIPGFDHAGIATQSLVIRKHERNFGTKGLSLEQLNGELHAYANSNRGTISKQLEALGALLDWEKEYYTLDPNHSEVVRDAFIHLFDSGIIQRGDGIINWSCPLQTSISDIEVEEVPFNGRTSLGIPGYAHPIDFGLLYFCEYSVPGSHLKVVVATSRPETMFGDTAIAVHPDDSRYKDVIGKSAISPLTGKALKIIADPRVKMDFGTGAVKITPAHDKFDFALGRDHNLPMLKTFNPDGSLNELCGDFTGMPRYSARTTIVKVLQDTGALLGTKEYAGSIGLCSRSQDVIEPYVIPHWFFKTKHLTDKLLAAIAKGEFKVKPEYQQQNFSQLLSAPHDWCLSRQIKWGHQIPAYRHKDYPESWVAANSLENAKEHLEETLKITINDPNTEIHQDPDVLDTWFSSALIPLSLAGWPDEEYQPLSLMETGFDIVLFWVWRMAIMNLALTEKLPFHNVLLHGVVVDSFGRKMSKSKGNVIDPMDVVHGRTHEELVNDTKDALSNGDLDLKEHDLRIDAINLEHSKGIVPCGADGLRFSLLGHDISLQQIRLNMTYVENCKHFCNKLWQAMRFYLLHADETINHPSEIAKPTKDLITSIGDQWILACLYEFAKNYEANVNSCQFHLATESIRNFLVAQYCDIYLELVKNDLRVNLRTEHHVLVMRYVFTTALKLAHPFLPFVTEEIWHELTQHKKGLILDTSLPTAAELEEFRNDRVIAAMRKGVQIAKEIRSLRVKYLPGNKEKKEFFIELPDDETDVIAVSDCIETLSRTNLKFDLYSPSRAKGDMIGTSFQIEGLGSCRISIAKSDVSKLPVAMDEIKLGKMQEKLSKLKRQFENPAFQQYAPTEAKERLKRRLDHLQMKIDEATSSQSSKNENS